MTWFEFLQPSPKAEEEKSFSIYHGIPVVLSNLSAIRH